MALLEGCPAARGGCVGARSREEGMGVGSVPCRPEIIPTEAPVLGRCMVSVK